MTMRTWLCVAPLVLAAGCSRSDLRKAGSDSVVGTQASAPAPGTQAVAASAPAAAPPAAPVETASAAAPDPEPVAPPEPTPVRAVVIPRGTAIHVRLDQTIDTRTSRPGERVAATLSTPIVVGGKTVVPAGTRFSGHVTVADNSGRLKGRAYIGVAMDSFHLNGRAYPIKTTSVERASASHKKRNGILIGGGAGVGGLLGAIAGGGKGALIGAGAGAAAGTAGAAATGKKHVSIPAESRLQFTIQSPVQM
jgi:hypothetical protein